MRTSFPGADHTAGTLLTCAESIYLLPFASPSTQADLKYTSDFFSEAMTYLIEKVSYAFQRFAELLAEFATNTHMRLTTTLLLPPTTGDDSSLGSINDGKNQLKRDAPRPGTGENTTRWLVNGKLVNKDNVEQLISEIERSTANPIKLRRIFSMFHQGFFATSGTSLLDHLQKSGLTPEKAQRAFEFANGTDIRLDVDGKSYLFKTTSNTVTMLDTEKQTITAHQLITPIRSDFPQDRLLSATRLTGFPDRPYYIKTTYHYGHPHTIRVEQVDPKYFPSSSLELRGQ